ncbi:MAG: trypsin-like peptidase domain-containing protein [Planctomycetota bacterium]|jgi:S1-C subfamily serine protease|nr:trypsin-like peptidase domain-containing protein [Planctomycetota bacterium]
MILAALLSVLPLVAPPPSTGDGVAAPDPTQGALSAVCDVALRFRDPSGNPVRVERPSSGVLVDPRGTVITARHLIEEALAEPDEYWIEVVPADGRARRARCVAEDERTDLALLELETADDERLPAIAVAGEESVRAGAWVCALGRPRGAAHAFAGVARHPNGPVDLRGARLEAAELLLADAALLTEIDGGPLIDSRGALVGLCNASHVLELQREPEEGETIDLGHGLVLSVAALRATFPQALPAATENAPPADLLADAVAAVGEAIVTVWAGAAETRPARPAAHDPHGRHPPAGLGSGVLIDPGNLVLTHSNLLSGSPETITVFLRSQSAFPATVVERRGTDNTALLRLELPEGVRLPAATLGNSAAALPGEAVAVVAAPFARALSVSAGVLAACEEDAALRLSAEVHGGQAGAALVDGRGRVIGLADPDLVPPGTAAEVENGLSEATPIDAVRAAFAEAFEEHGGPAPTPAAPALDEGDERRRESGVPRVVGATRDALLNVYVKVSRAEPAGFDPFGSEQTSARTHGLGSGVVIDESGLALTNWHVVDSATESDGTQRPDHELEVSLPNGQHYAARVLSTSRDDDLALLQLELAESDEVRAVPFGDSEALAVGERVVAIGNPFGLANTVSAGIVSTLDRDTRISGRVRAMKGMIQTDAAINPGNSGGALLDLEGRLVGINSAGSSWIAGRGFAIPVERIKTVFRERLLSAQGLRSAYLGLSVSQDEGKAFVVDLDLDGPAARAGVEEGDRLVAISGETIDDRVAFTRIVLAARPGADLVLELEREGRRLRRSLVPQSHTVWTLYRQCGLELEAIDYGAETDLVRSASIDLHRAFTGDPDGTPSELMSGAVRVARVSPAAGGLVLSVDAGDLLLGLESSERGLDLERTALRRLEGLADAGEAIGELATLEGGVARCWFWRSGEVFAADVPVRRAR